MQNRKQVKTSSKSKNQVTYTWFEFLKSLCIPCVGRMFRDTNILCSKKNEHYF